jgi:hypothetical protein
VFVKSVVTVLVMISYNINQCVYVTPQSIPELYSEIKLTLRMVTIWNYIAAARCMEQSPSRETDWLLD